MNLSTDAESFEKSIRIPFKKDSFNPVRAEYSQMLKKQLAQGNNGLTKTKYLTFGIEAESMRQAKPRLNHIENDLLNNFRRLGVIATTMNGKERLHLMHSMFHMGDNDKFFFDWKYLVESGLSVKDFYIIIDRDDKGEETVHFLNQVDEADLLKLMDEEEVAEFTKPVEETKPEVVETVPEITEPTPEEKPKSTNMLPAILTLIVLACGGGFFVFKKVQEKKKAQEAAKPDPDADYVDDDEDYGYDPEFEDDDADSSVDEDDNEPV